MRALRICCGLWVTLLTAAVLILLSQPAVAASQPVVLANPGPEAVHAFWTPERLRDAQPLPLPMRGPAVAEETSAEASGVSIYSAGKAPVAGVPPDLESRLFEPAEADGAGEPAAADSPVAAGKAAGTSNAYFTSSRLIPITLDTTYPYSAVGKLFYTIPGRPGTFYCTAAVLRPRIIVTAAQCLHSGTASPGFHANFVFVPASRDSSVPFGSWPWKYVIVNSGWTGGHGTVPNAVDYGFIEVQDQVIGGVTRRLGDVVGYLGFQTQRLHPNHGTIFGYTSNYDSGNKIHQVTAGSFRNKTPNCSEYGTDLRSGSSGGPIIQDFGDVAASVRVVGVLSYGYTSTAYKLQGASIPDNRWVVMFNLACAHRSGNC